MIYKIEIKHWFCLSLFTLISSFCSAQEAIDFTLTDTKGKEWNLYKELDNGKTVVLDFFFKDCKPCQKLTPGMVNVFKDYGEDTSKLIILGISDRDNNIDLEKFDLDYGVNYPSAGSEGGGDSITELYKGFFNFTGWPVYAVICPNRQIYWNLNRDSSFVKLREKIDSCTQVVSLISQKKTPFIYFPNPITNIFNIEFESNKDRKISIYCAKGERVNAFNIRGNRFSEELIGLINGMYFLQIESKNSNHIIKIEINKL